MYNEEKYLIFCIKGTIKYWLIYANMAFSSRGQIKLPILNGKNKGQFE
jgi:hypothetical protein